MKKLDSALPAKPTVQVIERMFTLLEILADREAARGQVIQYAVRS